jgi:hypothetical protein
MTSHYSTTQIRRRRGIDDEVGGGVEIAGEAAEDGGLATIALGGKERDPVAVKGEAQAIERLVEAHVREQAEESGAWGKG